MRWQPFDVFFYCLGFASGLASAVFVFRVCRRSVSPHLLFHVVFGVGFSLLCFSLWLILISMPLLRSPLVFDWSTQVLLPLFTAPLTCLALIPVAVFLLSYATFRDCNRESD